MYRSIWHWLCIWYKCFCLNTWENTHSEVICFQPSLWSAEIFLVAQICCMNEIVPFEMLQVQQWRLRGFPFCMLHPNKIHPFPSPFLGFRPIVTIKWQFVKGNTLLSNFSCCCSWELHTPLAFLQSGTKLSFYLLRHSKYKPQSPTYSDLNQDGGSFGTIFQAFENSKKL